MHAIHSQPAGARTGWPWGAPAEASAAVLEVVASEQPELVEFQAQALFNSTMSFARLCRSGLARDIGTPANMGGV